MTVSMPPMTLAHCFSAFDGVVVGFTVVRGEREGEGAGPGDPVGHSRGPAV